MLCRCGIMPRSIITAYIPLESLHTALGEDIGRVQYLALIGIKEANPSLWSSYVSSYLEMIR
jgi:hypothetical protein